MSFNQRTSTNELQPTNFELSPKVEERADDLTEGWSLPPEREAAEFDLEVTVHLIRGENVAVKDLLGGR